MIAIAIKAITRFSMWLIKYTSLPQVDGIGVFDSIKTNTIVLIEGNTISNNALAQILQRAKIRAQELKSQMTHWKEEWNKNCNGPAVCIEISSSKAMGHDFYKLLDEFLDMDKPIDKIEAGAAFYSPKPRPLKEI